MAKFNVSDFVKGLSSSDAKLLEDYKPLDYYIDTGNYLLNMQCSTLWRGGLEAGTNTMLSGDPSTGKTLSMEMMTKNFLDSNENAMVLWVDAEHQLAKERFEKYMDRIIHSRHTLIEDVDKEIFNFLHACEKGKHLKHGVRSLILVDSIGALGFGGALDLDKDGYMKDTKSAAMRDAKLLTDFARRTRAKLYEANASLIMANWLYTVPSTYGPAQKTEKGGNGLIYQCNNVLRFNARQGDKDDDSEFNKTTNKYIRIEMRKARTVKEQTNVIYPIEFNKGGLTRYGGLFEFCLGLGLIEKNGGYYKFTWEEKNHRKTEFEDNPAELFTPENLDRIQEAALPVFGFSGNPQNS